ncbi:MAG: nucleoside-diphosphate kinase [Alphaproteobacteria bacterium]
MNKGFYIMAIERTLSIIKPDATEKNIVGKILTRFEDAGLKVAAMKKMKLDDALAGGFYAEHKERPFFGELVGFMTSGPVVVTVLEGENAINTNRDLMGATNPAEAETGTIRRDFCESIDANGVHGSDSAEAAEREINYFFKSEELVG